MSVKRRQFSEAFKRRAVARVAGLTAANAARKLKIEESMVYLWRKKFGGEIIGLSLVKTRDGKLEWTRKPGTVTTHSPGIAAESIIYLRNAVKAWNAGNSKKGELLARLALLALEEK